jgi:hypothetical protein
LAAKINDTRRRAVLATSSGCQRVQSLSEVAVRSSPHVGWAGAKYAAMTWTRFKTAAARFTKDSGAERKRVVIGDVSFDLLENAKEEILSIRTGT